MYVIDDTIERYRRILLAIGDQVTIERTKELIENSKRGKSRFTPIRRGEQSSNGIMDNVRFPTLLFAPHHRRVASPDRILLAMVLFEKFGQHQPLNRQSERYRALAGADR